MRTAVDLAHYEKTDLFSVLLLICRLLNSALPFLATNHMHRYKAASQHCPKPAPSLQDLIILHLFFPCISPIDQLDENIVCCSSSRLVALSLLVFFAFYSLYTLSFALFFFSSSPLLPLTYNVPIAPPVSLSHALTRALWSVFQRSRF
ncbi:hypothetical protein CI102_14129 [Trichoderma harzianum]|nr:hypothetical protein CI102_14129 [Trichoderma harzianum]